MGEEEGVGKGGGVGVVDSIADIFIMLSYGFYMCMALFSALLKCSHSLYHNS